MRIAYVVPWSDEPTAGAMKKVEAQVAHWERAGHVARIFVLRMEAHASPAIVTDERHVVIYGSMWERLGAVRRLMAAVAEWQPSIVYARYNLWWPSLPALARRVPAVIEINTDERHAPARLPRRMFNRLTRRSVLSACAGLVFVTPELAQSPRFAWYRGRSTVIANSFDLESVPQSPAPKNGTRLVFMGTGHLPHGVDHVVRLASLFPEWDFDLIGVTEAEVPSVPSNVQCHGFLSKTEYEPIVRSANVAVGPLAMYRVGLHEASALKVREYLAYGLPTIIGHRDPDFPDGAPYLLRIPNGPDAVDVSVEQIRAFVLEWRGRRVDRDSIRQIDMSAKETERLAFFEEIVRDFAEPSAPLRVR